MPSGLEAKSKEVDFRRFWSAGLRLQQSAPLEEQCRVVLELLPFGALKELDEHVSMMIQTFSAISSALRARSTCLAWSTSQAPMMEGARSERTVFAGPPSSATMRSGTSSA